MNKIKAKLLDASQISAILTRLSHEIVEDQKSLDSIAIIGIRTRGEVFAKKIVNNIQNIYKKTVDI